MWDFRMRRRLHGSGNPMAKKATVVYVLRRHEEESGQSRGLNSNRPIAPEADEVAHQHLALLL